jgi:hypothetical protein
MKRRHVDKQTPQPDPSAEDADRIDARYGLEPVFEPGACDRHAGGSDESQFQSVRCPYCGEHFEALLDLSAGSANYVEDCQICCQPIELSLEVDHRGALVSLTALRSD